MAIVKTVLAKDNRKAIVRVTATSAGNATIDIDADFLIRIIPLVLFQGGIYFIYLHFRECWFKKLY